LRDADMLLYIVRHAWARPVDETQWPDDRLRPLTEEGRKRFAKMIKKLVKRGFAVDLIVSSPLVRCVETAEIMRQRVTGRPKAIHRAELAPGGDLARLLKWMESKAAGRHEAVAWVGHAPDVGRITAALIGQGSAAIDFPKGGVAAVSFENRPHLGAGQLEWLVTAKLLRC
jgi:phosphohistidine phosphatase